MFKLTKIALLSTSLMVSFCAIYNIVSPSREIKRGSFVHPENSRKYEYVINKRGNSQTLSAWEKGRFVLFAPINLTDSDSDGLVDEEGIFWSSIPAEDRKKAQEIYNLTGK